MLVSFLILSVTSFIDGCRQAEGDGKEVGCCMQVVGGALAPKAAFKVAPKRKNKAKDDHPSKKATGPFVGDQ